MEQPNNNIKFTDQQLKKARNAFGDFIQYCETYLKIKDMGGKLIPFKLNRPQRRFVKTIFKQWKEQGYIKVVIVKARKMGFTTLVTAFIFWYLMANPVGSYGRAAVAGTHLESSNAALMEVFERFYENYPKEIRASLGTSNTEKKVFDDTNCSYKIVVASNVENVGRADTAQILHVSEIAHIKNAGKLAESLFPVIGEGDQVIDTMTFVESTANGMNNYHYTLYRKAVSKAPGCDYIPFFAPWFEDERYTKQCPPDFALTEAEQVIKKRFNLTDEQICWRRSKIAGYHGTEKQQLISFNQEYPDTPENAFASSPIDSYIAADDVNAALERPPRNQGNDIAVVAAFDPSLKGVDRDVFIVRHGSNIFGLEVPYFGDDHDARVRFLQSKLDNKVLNIDMLFLDAGGGGYALRSSLNNLGYGDRCKWIEFGAGADDVNKAKYKRDEMFVDFNDLLTDKHLPLSISIPEEYKEDFIADLTATGYKTDHMNRPKMESKDNIKSRTGRSTDIMDACCLLVAQPVRKRIASPHRYDRSMSPSQRKYNRRS